MAEHTFEAFKRGDITGAPIELGSIYISATQSHGYVYINSGRCVGVTPGGKITLELITQEQVNPEGQRFPCALPKPGTKASYYSATLIKTSHISYTTDDTEVK